MSDTPPTNTSNETSSKAKKARKPFVWTEQKRANFEKMRQKRAEQLANKRKSKEDEKSSIQSDKNHIERLVRIKNEMKHILQVLETKSEPVKEVVVSTKKDEVKPVLPEPEPPSDHEEEQEYIPPIKLSKPKDPPNLYRYNTTNQHKFLPKTPAPVQLPKFENEVKKTPAFTYV